MAALPLTYAPHPIFKQICDPVTVFDEDLRLLVDAMFETLNLEQAVGMGAPMVGIQKQIAIVDLHENHTPNPHIFINPSIIWHSEETQTHEEASICFPGISAPITRANAINVSFQDIKGQEQSLEAEGFFATVIQHEIDYLQGKVFLDYLSKMKQGRLLKKMEKHMKMNPPTIHGTSCHCC